MIVSRCLTVIVAALRHLQHFILKSKSNEPQTFSWTKVIVTVSRLEVFWGHNLTFSLCVRGHQIPEMRSI